MPAKKPVRRKTTKAVEKPASPAPSVDPASVVSTQPAAVRGSGGAAIVLVIIAVFAVAIVVASRRTPDSPRTDDTIAQPVAATPGPAAVKPVGKVALPASPKASTPSAAAPAVAAKTDSDESESESPAIPAVSATVTIDGCLERSGNGFRLKDTSGADAPKSRSWKSGFLKKGSVPIQIVDAANGLRLASHLGERVSVTGTMIDREMRAHALRSLAASCK